VGIDEGGDRRPEASTLAALALGWVAEASVTYGDDAEFRDDVFDEDGTMLPSARRRILRRRLDVDPDAPHPRLLLAKLLLAEGKARGALQEIEQTLRRAPEYCWAHHEGGHAHAALGDATHAVAAHEKAAQTCPDPELAVYFLAWAARRAEGTRRAELGAPVRAQRPDFVQGQLAGARHRLDDDDPAAPLELVELGLAVQPTHVELLELRQRLAAQPAEPA
jgi:tetratricopeptide (TPR) repeat protein